MTRSKVSSVANKNQSPIDAATPLQASQLRRQSSPPIPIQNPAPVLENSPDSDSVGPEYYNHLTWRMYHRIVEARRIRAHIRRSSGSIDEYSIARDESYETFQDQCKFMSQDQK